MRLTVYNGSPRGVHSNTKVLLSSFLKGFVDTPGNSYELTYLINKKRRDEHLGLFRNADHVLLAFPLYFDSMPAAVKEFIEALAPLRGRVGNPSIGFIVQSGFPESIHSEWLARYLARLAKRLGSEFKGTVIRGGVEGIRISSRQQSLLGKLIIKIAVATNLARVGHFFNTEKICRTFFDLGKIFGKTSHFDQEIIAALAQPRRISKLSFWIVKTAVHLIYWDQMLKSNNAYGQRFMRPYTT